MEIESKYRVSDAATFTMLKTLPGVGPYLFSPGELLFFQDTYYDTADNHLLSAGYALRYRRYQDRVKVSLKSLSPPTHNLHIREEIEVDGTGIYLDQPATWIKTEIGSIMWRITGGHVCVPLFQVKQERFLRKVTYQHQTIAECCVDLAECSHRGHLLQVRGLELELTDSGSRRQLTNLSQKLETLVPLLPETRSKFEIFLAFTRIPDTLLCQDTPIEPEPPVLQLDDSLATAIQETMRYHFKVMKHNDAGSYRGEDINYVHDMRVAIRRMRTAFRVFSTFLDPVMVRPTLSVLRKTGRILGVVRDMDVFRENFELYACTNNLLTSQSSISTAWNVAYTSARQRLTDFLSGKKYTQFRDSFSQNVISIVTPDAHQITIREQLQSILNIQQAQAIAHYQQLESIHPTPLPLFHQMRIILKHYRYTLEYFRSILGEQGEALITETQVVQDHLGALQDAVVARKNVRTILQWGMWTPPLQPYVVVPTNIRPSPDVEGYVNALDATINQLVETFPPVWQHFTNVLPG